MMKLHGVLLLSASSTDAFSFTSPLGSRPLMRQYIAFRRRAFRSQSPACRPPLFMSTTKATAEEPAASLEHMPEVTFGPILEELRDVAMRLHTKEQAPREGEAPAPSKPDIPFVPTTSDYLQFLVDSEAVYSALEEVVNSNVKLAEFRNSGLERTQELAKDIMWMCNEYGLERPEVGMSGMVYAEELRAMVQGEKDVPEFMCHYYNYYFAHMAGGMMIGKKMSKLLLGGAALEFYQWGDIDIPALKAQVKGQIETLAQEWTREERDKCINATASAFRRGGAINGYLFGRSPH